MSEINIDIRFEGENFLPGELAKLTGFPLEIIAESGKTAKRGRYKGSPSPYGMALLKVEKDRGEGNVTKALNTYLSTLITHQSLFSQTGLEEIIVDIDAPLSKVSEFSLDNNSLAKISQLNATVDLCTYNDDEFETLIRNIITHIGENILDDNENKTKLESKIRSKEFKEFTSKFFDLHNKKDSKENLARSYFIMFLLKQFEKDDFLLSDVKKILT